MSETKQSSSKKSIFTPERTAKFFVVSFIAYAIAAMIIWPLLEFLFSKFTNSSYTWTVKDGIIEPIIFSIIFTAVEFATWNTFHKKK